MAGSTTWSVTWPTTSAEATVMTAYSADPPTANAKLKGCCVTAYRTTFSPLRTVPRPDGSQPGRLRTDVYNAVVPNAVVLCFVSGRASRPTLAVCGGFCELETQASGPCKQMVLAVDRLFAICGMPTGPPAVGSERPALHFVPQEQVEDPAQFVSDVGVPHRRHGLNPSVE